MVNFFGTKIEHVLKFTRNQKIADKVTILLLLLWPCTHLERMARRDTILSSSTSHPSEQSAGAGNGAAAQALKRQHIR